MMSFDLELTKYLSQEVLIHKYKDDYDAICERKQYLLDEYIKAMMSQLGMITAGNRAQKDAFICVYLGFNTPLSLIDKNVFRYILNTIDIEYKNSLDEIEKQLRISEKMINDISTQLSALKQDLKPRSIDHLIYTMDERVIGEWQAKNNLESNWLAVCKLCVSPKCAAPISHRHYNKVAKTIVKYTKMPFSEKLKWRSENIKKVRKIIKKRNYLENLLLEF